ncbi:hypothetical protein SAMN05192571_101484 [Pleomorphomonas diazotrophica]|nr:hypothetical protein SAMN05192571_101484 [Pleomorphomonas diazotrophica]
MALEAISNKIDAYGTNFHWPTFDHKPMLWRGCDFRIKFR